ncbi:hypothetical protein KJ815_01185 [bacterium]|nr:hypothetical protein [bacterium]
MRERRNSEIAQLSTEQRKQRVVATLTAHPALYRHEVAELAGVTPQTVEQWAKDDPLFAGRWEAAKDVQITHLHRLLERARRGKVTLTESECQRLETFLSATPPLVGNDDE